MFYAHLLMKCINMKVKISTKEKFTVLFPEDKIYSANMAAEIAKICSTILEGNIKNVIINLGLIELIDEFEANSLVNLQQSFYEKNASFVICCMQKSVEQKFDEMELLEFMNCTPSESEAWDIIQMEEIERELLDGDDIYFDPNN